MLPAIQNNLSLSRIFIFGLILCPVIAAPYVLDFTLTARFTTLSAVLGICVYLLYKKGYRFTFKPDIVVASYCAYACFCGLSFFWSNTRSEALFEFSRTLLGLGVFLFGVFLFKEKEKKTYDGFLRFCILLPFIALPFALYQLSAIDQVNKESIYSITGINGHKNLFTSFLFLNLFFLVSAFQRSGTLWKILSVLSIVLSCAVILFLRTKAVWIGGAAALLFIAAMIYLFPFTKKIKINFYVALFACLLIANIFFLLVLPGIIDKGLAYNKAIASSVNDQKQTELDNERLVLWNKSYSMFKKHPVVGVGAGNWQIHFPDQTLSGLWRAEDLNYTFQRPHNDFLWILSETGLIGFNLYIIFILSLIILGLKAFHTAQSAEVRHEIILGLAIMIGFLIISFFDFPKERIEHLAWINFIAAILYFRAKALVQLPPVLKIQVTPKMFPMAAICMALILLTGIMRHRGEYYTRKMYDARNSGYSVGVIKAGNKAQSFAYSVDPTSVPLLWYTGNAKVSIGDQHSAKTDFLKASEINPYNRNVLNDLGSSFALSNDPETAKNYYLEAIRISPRFDDAKLNLVALYIREKEFNKADACLKSLFHDSERRSKYQRMVDAFLGRPLEPEG